MSLVLSEIFSKKSKLILNKINGRFNWNLLNSKHFSTKKVKDKNHKERANGIKTILGNLQPPKFAAARLDTYNALKAKYVDEINSKPQTLIKVTLPNDKIIEGTAWKSTPYEIAKTISEKYADRPIVARVNEQIWDMNRPLEKDSNLQFLSFNDEDGREVFWHSSSHVLGEALESIYGGLLCCGPATADGFYYDMWHEGKGISSNDHDLIETLTRKLLLKKNPFERLVVSKSDALELFGYNKFKLEIIEKRIDDETVTVYRCGNLVDLCAGPHLRSTSQIKATKIYNNSLAHWNADISAERLERINGVSFTSTKEMEEWEEARKDAEQRNHRKIGREQNLFFFHESSPGSCFFQPRGAHIYNTLVNFIKTEYRKRGFEEVITPNIFNVKLWKESGHWEHYSQNMYAFKSERETFALKPMNCPGHCLIYKHDIRSWRDLPIRLADFGVLHRKEYGLSGLTRVCRFQQDDAHIFCRPDQIESEIHSCLEFMAHVYKVLGFSFSLVLSTRPDEYMGELEVWDKAEEALKQSLEKFGEPWMLNEADGAFYGPKIDITITDALNRAHQCATIQLDFQLPQRFELCYDQQEGQKDCPVMIHRAIFGSVERLFAILTENYFGKWPFWLSPRQVMIVPVDPVFNDYAESVRQLIHNAGFMVDFDTDVRVKMNKKIRRAQLDQYNFILVVGEKERSAGTVNVRTRDNKIHGEFSTSDLISRLQKIRDDFVTDEKVF